MRQVVVIDDNLLVLHLAGIRSWLPQDVTVATTSSWWFRVARAVERAAQGSLSRLIVGATEGDEASVEALIRDLPEDVALLHPRAMVPVAAGLSARYGLNLIAADALATAIVLDGRVLVAVQNDGPKLRAAAAASSVAYDTIEP